MSPLGAPCNPPPWGVLTAVDVATGEKRWEVPLGTTRDLAPFPVWLFAPKGVPNIGGPITTASGLTVHRRHHRPLPARVPHRHRAKSCGARACRPRRTRRR
jgi:glucose dehydrogenase